MKTALKYTVGLVQICGLILISGSVIPAYAEGDQVLRYRGQYTYAHEVNTFCPKINSQCYWLDPQTPAQIRQQLKQLSEKLTSRPYEAICLVLQGQIDRETKSDGFAADYDGLIRVSRVFGLCDKTDIVTQGDLQHHRWILESINGENINLPKQSSNLPDTNLNGQVPASVSTGSNVLDLDFGEQMTVAAKTGCNILSSRAVLRENQIIFTMRHSSTLKCSAKDQTVNLLLNKVFNSEPKITIDSNKNLILEGGDTLLKYQLKDWVH